MTSLNLHLIGHVAITPLNKLSYLNAALVDLNFGPTIEHFGMFFLHDLAIDTGTLEGLESEDDGEVARVMKLDQKAKRTKQNASWIQNSEPNTLFPYGDSPPWETIVNALRDSPEKIIRGWIWDPTWDGHPQASRLFCQMAVDLWLIVGDKALARDRPRPTSLEQAMRVWTVTDLQETLLHSQFIASGQGLRGARMNQKQLSFRSMVDVFFPLPTKKLNDDSVWKPFVTKGYIKEFHRLARSLPAEQLEDLLKALRTIFYNLQCLPFAQSCQTQGNRKKGQIWKSAGGWVEMQTNPRFYRVLRIGKKEVKKKTGTRLKASKAVVEARLDQEHRGIPYKMGRREYTNRQRSAKRLNYRQPPKKPGKKAVTIGTEHEPETESDSDQEDIGSETESNSDKEDTGSTDMCGSGGEGNASEEEDELQYL